MRSLFLAAAMAVASVSSTSAEACSCLAPDVIFSYNSYDHAFLGRVIGGTQHVGNFIVYDVYVLQTTKSCLPERTIVKVATPDNGAACGTSFVRGGQYLFFGQDGTIRGRRVILTNACAANKRIRDLTPDERDFLGSRPLNCAGQPACADGRPEFACLIDPCVLSTCSDPTATCDDNYCGGCIAEWTTPLGYGACLPW